MASLWTEELGEGRYRVRWREKLAGPDGKPYRKADGRWADRVGTTTVEADENLDEVTAQIRRDLREKGSHTPRTATPEPTIADLEKGHSAFLYWKSTRCEPSSCARYTQHVARFAATVRKLRGIKPEATIPVTVLSRDLVTECVCSWQRDGLSESVVYGTARTVVEMWGYLFDDPTGYPGVPSPPRITKAVLPRAPLYVAPAAPTLAEVDACLRHLPLDATISRRLGVWLRFTGLRADQALSIRRRDVDLPNLTLTVTTGKSREEKAEQRVIPLARALVAEVREWVEPLPPGALLFPSWGRVESDKKATIKSDQFRLAWQEATKWGEAREAAWKPATRKIGRPEHALRSAFQAHLRLKGIGDEVIDALVGHHGKTTRARHYAGAETLLPRMRAAVEQLSPIDWIGPKEAKIVKMRRA